MPHWSGRFAGDTWRENALGGVRTVRLPPRISSAGLLNPQALDGQLPCLCAHGLIGSHVRRRNKQSILPARYAASAPKQSCNLICVRVTSWPWAVSHSRTVYSKARLLVRPAACSTARPACCGSPVQPSRSLSSGQQPAGATSARPQCWEARPRPNPAAGRAAAMRPTMRGPCRLPHRPAPACQAAAPAPPPTCQRSARSLANG